MSIQDNGEAMPAERNRRELHFLELVTALGRKLGGREDMKALLEQTSGSRVAGIMRHGASCHLDGPVIGTGGTLKRAEYFWGVDLSERREGDEA